MSTRWEHVYGKRITAYRLDTDRHWLELHCDDGTVLHLECMEECCSATWIESLDMPGVLRGRLVRIEDRDMPDLGNIVTPWAAHVEEVKYYGLAITTEHGTCVIDYRNNSNGYYGGDMILTLQEPAS